MKLNGKKIGLAVTGSFCNYSKISDIINRLKEENVEYILPIVSSSVLSENNRFTSPYEVSRELQDMCKNDLIDTITKAEPIGPKNMIDVLVIVPCTGNTIAKLANGITDGAVTMAFKSHIRNNKPVVIGISTNDGLGINAKNIAELLNYKNIFFIPFGQDDYTKKPKSLVCDYNKTIETIELSLGGDQIQPIIIKK